MTGDELTDLPSFAANRDEAVSSASRRAIPQRVVKSPRGIGLIARLTVTIAFASAAVACAWAWQLQILLDELKVDQISTQTRVKDLEALLSNTDETVNKSSAALSAQLRLLDTEVRKLWDARKVNNAKMIELDKLTTLHNNALDEITIKTVSQGEQIEQLKLELSTLIKVSGDLERVMVGARQAQTELERLADGINRANLELAGLRKQVQSNSEWIDSINAFRRQVNMSISDLEAKVRDLRAPSMQ